MARKTTLETIWYIPDDLWDKIRPLLGREKKAGTVGRPAVPYRTCLDGILFVLRTGCQWKHAPREFGSGSTLHRRFQQWAERGSFKRVWRLLLREYDEWRGIRWRWQAIDSATTKAPLGGEATGKSPVDRGKLGTKRHVLTDQRGAPIGFEVTGANRHDSRAVRATLDSLPVKRPTTGAAGEQHLTADKGYDYPAVRHTLKRRGYTAHIPKRDGQPPKQRGKRRYKAKRWVVERTHSWTNRYRRLLVRWEKKETNYLALVHFAFALNLYRLIILG
ncbi:MAG TPA: IS5 family transposase [Pyrinomonadaceae bacterium]|nr:IS5 family transposase [Pyrinomonadaceae bacterium]